MEGVSWTSQVIDRNSPKCNGNLTLSYAWRRSASPGSARTERGEMITAPPAPAHPARASGQGPVRLLILEDAQEDVELVLDALSRRGFVLSAVAAVATRQEYLQRLQDFDPELIISDYALPGFCGEEALALARRHRPDVPFIFVSGMLGEDRAVELLKVGAWDYVLKDRLARLGPAVGRALAEAAELAARRRLQAERETALEELRRSDERLRAAMAGLEGLQQIAAALGATLTERDVSVVLATSVCPRLGADLAVVGLVDPTRQFLGVDPETASRYGLPPSWRSCLIGDPGHPLAAAFRQDRPVFLGDGEAAGRMFPEWSATSPGKACALLPLGGQRRFGVLVVIWKSGCDFSDARRAFLSTIAMQCTQALERARLFERQANHAQALQQALLPSELPEVAGLRSVARYLPAHGDAVGGDWYDVFRLPSGSVALVMGDVEGHSGVAAAIMGQARNVLRAYAADGHNPAEIMRRLNQFLSAHTDRIVTCCYAELDPARRIVTAVSAGHPAPVVQDPGGDVYPLNVCPGLPLGVEVAALYDEYTSVLPPQGRLIMFTDGLVDCSRAVYGDMEEFVDQVSHHADDEPDVFADALVTRQARDTPLPDDAALLVVQLTETAHASVSVASRTFRSTPAAAGSSRHFLRDVLTAWQLDDFKDTAALAVSELMANAVLHTAGDVQLAVRRLGECGIWIGVTDDSDRLPQLRQATDEDISGRGLSIVDLVSDTWGVTLDAAGGKTVWLRLSREPA